MCTGIIIVAEDGTVVAARTLEFAVTLDWYQVCPGEDPRLDGVVAGTAAVTDDDPCIVDGVNSSGLFAGSFYFECSQQRFYTRADSEIEDASSAAPQLVTLSTLNVARYFLQKCDSVEAVVECCADMRVSLGEVQGRALPLHFIVCDKTADSAVVEVSGHGKVGVRRGPGIRVITNYPFYDEQRENLKRYSGCSPVTKKDSCYQGTGQGNPIDGTCSQECCLPGDATSPSRFVRASFYLENLPTPKDGLEAVQRAFSILRNFDIPYGSILSYGDLDPEVTQYTVVYNVSSRAQMYAPYGYKKNTGTETWLATSAPVKMCPSTGDESRQRVLAVCVVVLIFVLCFAAIYRLIMG